MPSLLTFLLIMMVPMYAQTCTTPDAAAITDTTPDHGIVPTAPINSPVLTDSSLLSGDYYFYPLNGDDQVTGMTPFVSYNATSFTSGELSFTHRWGSSVSGACDWDAGYANLGTECQTGWNGYLVPSINQITGTMDASPFSKLYNSYDHVEQLWYTVSFDFRAPPTNSWESGAFTYSIKVIFFDMDKLDTYWFPNNIGEKWLWWPQLGVYHYAAASNDWSTVNREVISVQLSDDSLTNGVSMWDNFEGGDEGNVWISFPETTSTDWTTFQATFKFNREDNTPGCENCYAAFYIENSVYPSWNTDTTWIIRNLQLTRDSSSVTWEDPITSFDGERVTLRRMEYLTDVEAAGWSRTDCPHLWSGLYDWHDPATWDSGVVPNIDDAMITLPQNKPVIIRSCSLNASNSVSLPYQKIYIPLNGSLIFDDVDITLYVEEIYNDGGSIWIGNEECRLYSNIQIHLVGSRATSYTGNVAISGSDPSSKSKGIITHFGSINIHGKQFHPTWTRIAITIYPGENTIYLQESVNWEVGQRIVVLTSAFLDYEDNHQNEEFTIVAIANSSWTQRNVIYLGPTTRTVYHHYAGIEYQAEVLLLSRNIELIGSDSGDLFGGHNAVNFAGSIGKFSGVSAYNMGQQNVEGRYPFHFHMIGDCPECFVRDCSVYYSNFRCVTVHGTNYMTVTRHTSYNSYGHCLYIEDGVEENNTLSYNALTHVHPIHHSAGGSCEGEVVCVDCTTDHITYLEAHVSGTVYNFNSGDILIPSDVAASPFYAVNTYNRFIGNVASGGWSGFAFINFVRPLGKFLGNDYSDTFTNPYQRPALEFDGNVAHSSGFRWSDSGCGSCFYGGGELAYSDTYGSYYYTTGRIQHDTSVPYVSDSNGDAIPAWVNINNTKTYLCQIGINWWGNRVVITNFESHDAERGAFFIGENILRHAIVNARSGNHIGSAQIGLNQQYPLLPPRARGGHQLYDTFVHLYLDDIIWRNFLEEPIIIFLAFSNIFTPQGIAAVRNMEFDNCTHPEHFIHYDYCGEPCALRDNESVINYPDTQAARIYAIYDYDGTASGTGVPTIISTHNNWWNTNTDCIYDGNHPNGPFLWYCPMDGRHEIGYLRIDIPGLTDGFRDNPNPVAAALTGNAEDSYFTGYISQFGRNYSIPYPYYPSVAGPTNMGWYFRSIYGAPSYWFIGPDTAVWNGGIQIPRNNFIVVSMKYPLGTTFEVTADWSWMGGASIAISEATSMDEMYTAEETLYNDLTKYQCPDYDWGTPAWYQCTDTNSVGPIWYFDQDITEGTGFFYIRIVNLFYYINPIINNYQHWEFYWENEGLKLWDVDGSFRFYITATCDECTSSNNGFYDVEDSLPPKWPNQGWVETPSPTSEWVETTMTYEPTTIIMDISTLEPTDQDTNTDGGDGDGNPDGATKINISFITLCFAIFLAYCQI